MVADLWLLDLPKESATLRAWARVLDREERERRDRFTRPADGLRYEAAHIGLRLLLARYVDLDPVDLRFVRRPCSVCGRPHGKPRLRDRQLQWSMARSEELVLYAVASEPVGVDTERELDSDDVLSPAAMLHCIERAELEAIPGRRERVRAFLRCWVRKEAYLKGTGDGLNRGLAEPLVGVGAPTEALAGWWLTDVAVPGGYAAAAAFAQRAPAPPTLRELHRSALVGSGVSLRTPTSASPI